MTLTNVPRYWPFVRGIQRSPHKGQWRTTLKFSLICAWINSLVNNRKAGDLRRHRAHHVMLLYGMGLSFSKINIILPCVVCMSGPARNKPLNVTLLNNPNKTSILLTRHLAVLAKKGFAVMYQTVGPRQSLQAKSRDVRYLGLTTILFTCRPFY